MAGLSSINSSELEACCFMIPSDFSPSESIKVDHQLSHEMFPRIHAHMVYVRVDNLQ